MNIIKIYTANYESEGYHQGFARGEQNLSKHHLGALKTIHPINYLYRFNTAMKSYANAFDSGYTDGQRKREQLFSPSDSSSHSTNGGNAMSENNYGSIIHSLSIQIQEIERNIKQLDTYLENYLDQINAMKKAGFLDEYINKLREQYDLLEQDKNSLQKVLRRLLEKFSLAQGQLTELKNKIN